VAKVLHVLEHSGQKKPPVVSAANQGISSYKIELH
jgi:hypothetical protein